MNNKTIFLSFILILILSSPVYALSFQDVTNFFASIFNSIASFFNSAFSVLTPKTTTSGGGGGGGSSSGGSTLCSSSLSLSVTGKDTCTVTATITSSNCVKRTYEIKDGGSKCSGNITSSSFTKTCTWSVTSGSYTYTLYVDGEYKLSKSVSCSKTPPPTCSDGTQYNQCSSTKPKYCDNGNLINKCSSCGCPSGQNCNATTNVCSTPTACTCGSWINGACGSGGCASNQRQQTRTCSPTGCTPSDGLGTSKCVVDSSCITPSTCDSQCTAQRFSSGTCEAGNLATINKAVYVYGSWWTNVTDISFIAQHFNLLDTDLDQSHDGIPMMQPMQNLKAQNPNIKILGYKDVMGMTTYLDDWAEVNSHEDWFIHDANGNRIIMTVWGWYLMDVGSQGYRQHWVSYVNSKINNNAYDGVFADDVWNTIPDWSLSNFDKTIPASVISRWHNDMIGFLQYAKANLISGKILIDNSDEWSTNDYINITDGELIEGFAHAPWEPLSTYRNQIDVLARKSATGKIVWASSGIDSSTATQAQIDTMLKYCYASFLVGMSGSKAYWTWSTTGATYQGGLYSSYQPIMDTDIGQPIGAHYQSQNVSMRDYTKGKAIINPSSSTYTVNLGSNYKLLNGTTVSSVTLNSYSGEILLNSSSGSCQSGETSIGQVGCSSGICCCGVASTTTPVNKATYIYGLPPWSTIASYVGSHFQLLDIDFYTSATDLQRIKTANPNIKIIGYADCGTGSTESYWSTLNTSESNFLHDKNGHRLHPYGNDQPTRWIPDYSSTSAWRQIYSSWVNNLASSSLWDGVFMDNAWNSLSDRINWGQITNSQDTIMTTSDIDASILNNWHSNMVGFIQYVKTHLPTGKILVPNSDGTPLDYLAVTDGLMEEGAFHASWLSLTDYTQAPSAADTINSLAQKMATGKIIMVASGASFSGTTPPDATTQAQIAAMVKYCYAAFLLALNGPQGNFGFSANTVASGYVEGDGTYGYYPIMDTNIGQPIGAYYSSQNVYMRDFTGGKVLLNPTASTYTINLGGNYKTLDGATVSSVAMNAHTGEILLKV